MGGRTVTFGLIYIEVWYLQKEIYFLLFCMLARLLAGWLTLAHLTHTHDYFSYTWTERAHSRTEHSRAQWGPSKFHFKQANVLQWISSFIVVSSLLEVELSVCCFLWAYSKTQMRFCFVWVSEWMCAPFVCRDPCESRLCIESQSISVVLLV